MHNLNIGCLTSELTSVLCVFNLCYGFDEFFLKLGDFFLNLGDFLKDH